MKTSFVAGASGFIGSNLCRELLARGQKVIGIDNFSTSDGSNLLSLKDYENFEFINGSVLEVDSFPKSASVDCVFHLASPASPEKYQALGLETLKANTQGTENLIRFALDRNSALVFASTSEIYGDPQITPQVESYWGNVNPVGPRSVYDESKRLGETLVSYFNKKKDLRGKIVRIFNTYGPGMDPFDGRVVSSFIRQALLGEPFSVFGDGSQTRSFCYIDDLVSGLISMSESGESGPVNLGNPFEIDLLTLGDIVASVIEVDAKFTFQELPEDDPKQRRPDITLARNKLLWEPKTSLEKGIGHTAQWIKHRLEL
jgi:nucleoside-diphosphate-sugar epimerase